MRQLTIGQRIRLAREAKGMNQGELAKALGISQPSLSDLEAGLSKAPSAKVLLDMAETLKVTPRWIIYGDNGELTIPTPTEHALLDRFRELSAEQQQAILSTLSALGRNKG